MCPICIHSTTRFHRLRAHAVARHGLSPQSEKLQDFVRKCRSHNQRGVRVTSICKVRAILGRFCQRKSYLRVAKRILLMHNVIVKEKNDLTILIPHTPLRKRGLKVAQGTGGGESQIGFAEVEIGDTPTICNELRATQPPLQIADRHPICNDLSSKRPQLQIEDRPSICNDTVVDKQEKKRQRIPDIAKAGLVPKCNHLCSVAKQYNNFEDRFSTRSPSSTRANAKMIHRYMEWARENGDCTDDVKILCNSEMPMDFAVVMNKTFQPFTVKNHASAMVSLIDLILASREMKDALGLGPHMKSDLRNAREAWDLIKCKTQRVARAKQRVKTRSGQFQNAPMLAIADFLIENTPKCDQILLHHDRPELDSKSDIELVRCVCALFMALHGARLCAVLNLAKKELVDALCFNGRYILRIFKHKSARFHGPCSLALRPHQFRMLQAMSDFYGKGDKVFPINESGRACKELFAPFCAFFRKKYNLDPPDMTFNLVRKTIETNAFLEQSANIKARDAVSSYLCHGKQVTALHYAFKTEHAVVSEAKHVEEIVTCLVALDLVREKRIRLPKPLGKFN